MKEFDYAAAGSIDEAVSLLAARGDRARVLAGGTDILVQLREGQRDADLLVDVKKIPELLQLEYDSRQGLRLGAAVPCWRIYSDHHLATAYAALVDAARIIGGWQIQTRASVGGNLCNSSPAADSIPALLALQAKCQIAGAQGTRHVAVDQFCTAPGRNVLARGEFLVALEFAPPASQIGSAYLRFIPRNEMDIAVVGVGAWVQLDAGLKNIVSARVALGAVAPTPVLAADANAWLAGKPANAETFAQAGELAKKSATPISDRRGPAEYRTHLVGVMTKRALTVAVARAAGKPLNGIAPPSAEH